MADPAQQGAGLLFVDEEEAVIVLDGERSFSVRGSLSVFLKQVPEVLFREIKPPEPSLVLAEPNGGSFGAGTQAMTHSDPSVLSGELMAPPKDPVMRSGFHRSIRESRRDQGMALWFRDVDQRQ